MTRTKVETKGELKPSPNLVLNTNVGNSVIGIIQGRVESKTFPGNFSTILSVLETNGNTTLYDKETKTNREVDIEQGDNVFLAENTVLKKALSTFVKGEKVEIVYLGKGKAKKGRKAPYLYDVFRITGE